MTLWIDEYILSYHPSLLLFSFWFFLLFSLSLYLLIFLLRRTHSPAESFPSVAPPDRPSLLPLPFPLPLPLLYVQLHEARSEDALSQIRFALARLSCISARRAEGEKGTNK